MRRKDREVVNMDEIIGIISRCNTIRIGINNVKQPYVVPLSFGLIVEKMKCQ